MLIQMHSQLIVVLFDFYNVHVHTYAVIYFADKLFKHMYVILF